MSAQAHVELPVVLLSAGNCASVNRGAVTCGAEFLFDKIDPLIDVVHREGDLHFAKLVSKIVRPVFTSSLRNLATYVALTGELVLRGPVERNHRRRHLRADLPQRHHPRHQVFFTKQALMAIAETTLANIAKAEAGCLVVNGIGP